MHSWVKKFIWTQTQNHTCLLFLYKLICTDVHENKTHWIQQNRLVRKYKQGCSFKLFSHGMLISASSALWCYICHMWMSEIYSRQHRVCTMGPTYFSTDQFELHVLKGPWRRSEIFLSLIWAFCCLSFWGWFVLTSRHLGHCNCCYFPAQLNFQQVPNLGRASFDCMQQDCIWAAARTWERISWHEFDLRLAEPEREISLDSHMAGEGTRLTRVYYSLHKMHKQKCKYCTYCSNHHHPHPKGALIQISPKLLWSTEGKTSGQLVCHG